MVTTEKFSFLFGVVIGEKLFSITDTLSKALHKKAMCAMEAKRLAAITLSSLKEQKIDDHSDKIWEELLAKVDEFNAGEHQSESMKPVVLLLILMQHQNIVYP